MKASPSIVFWSIPKAMMLFFIGVQVPLSSNGQGLEAYQWSNRILLLTDTRFSSHRLQDQLALFKDTTYELEDRDLIVFLITGNEVRDMNGVIIDKNGKELRKSLQIENDFGGILLIGKDGGVKLRKPFEVTVQEIFDLIDDMPMRRAELKNGG